MQFLDLSIFQIVKNYEVCGPGHMELGTIKGTTKLVSGFLSIHQWSTFKFTIIVVHQISILTIYNYQDCVPILLSKQLLLLQLFCGTISILILEISISSTYLQHLKLYLLSEKSSENKWYLYTFQIPTEIEKLLLEWKVWVCLYLGDKGSVYNVDTFLLVLAC